MRTIDIDIDFKTEASKGVSSFIAEVSSPFGGKLIASIVNDGYNDLAVADLISQAINLTGHEGISGLGNVAYEMSKHMFNAGVNMTNDTVDKIINGLLEVIQDALAEKGVIEKTLKVIDYTNKTILIAKKGLQLTISAASATANLQKLAVCSVFDPDVIIVPSIKECANRFALALADLILEEYYKAKQLILDKYNSMICTNSASVTDNIIASVNGIFNEIEGIGSAFNIDSLLKQNTGFSVSEIRYMCNTGFMLIGMIERSVDMGVLDVANKKANATYTSDDKKNKSKKRLENLLKDYSKEEAKAKLLEWLGTLSILILNAFKLVVIKDKIALIKDGCQKMSTQGVHSFVDFLNIIEVIKEIFDLFGYVPGKEGIKFEDLKALAMSVIATAAKTADNAVKQVTSNALSIVLANIEQGREKGKQQMINAKNNLYDNSIDDKDTYEGLVYEISGTSYEGKSMLIDIVLYANPSLDPKIKNTFKGWMTNNKHTFNNAKIKQIYDNLKDIWDDKESPAAFTIKSTIDGITTNYVFNVTIDSTEYVKWLSERLLSDTSDLIKASYSYQPSLILNLSSLNIDMSLIESLFNDKVLLFDFIVLILDKMFPVFDLVQDLAKLYLNYLINKEYVKTKLHVDLANSLKKCALLIEKLDSIINLKDTNFFVVRTKKFANLIKEKIPLTIGPDGMAVIDVLNTSVLYGLCIAKGIVPECPLDLYKGTTLYFADSIEAIDSDSKYVDGSSAGISNIVINHDLGEVYYDSQNRPTLSSQIMRAMKNNEDPYLQRTPNIKTKDSTLTPMLSFLLAITVHSDEFEGLLSINLSSLDLCVKVDLLDTETGTPNFYEIIEFGDTYTGGEAVNFKWNVSPGQEINEKSILAFVYKDGELIPVRSKYTKGTVKGIKDTKIKSINEVQPYFHLYPDSCNRHICIEDSSIGNPVNFDMDKVKAIADEMGDAGEVLNMLLNNMVPAMLPILLLHADRPSYSQGSGCKAKHSKFVKEFNDNVKAILEKMKKTGSKDNIKATKGNPNEIKKISDLILEYSNKDLPDLIVKTYNKIYNWKCKGPTTFLDAEGLASDYVNSYKGTENIGMTDYNNYYMSLLASINLMSQNKHALRYYDLLSGIIEYRHSFELCNIQDIIYQFNCLYNDEINANIEDPYYSLKNLIRKDASYDAIYEYIKGQKLQRKLEELGKYWQYDGSLGTYSYYAYYYKYKKDNKNEDANEVLNAFELELLNMDNYKSAKYTGPAAQLANMFLYIRNYENAPKHLNTASTDNIYNKSGIKSTKELITLEATLLASFWSEMIMLYNNIKPETTIQNLKAYCNRASKSMPWPTPVEVNIKNDNYKIYTFLYPEDKDLNIDLDLSDVKFGDVTAPELSADVSNGNIDSVPICDINEPGNITMNDYLYWLVYMTNATMFTLIPTYYADGFDVPPDMTPTPLPAIYFPIAKPVLIPTMNILIVFGLAIRGIWVFPIILIVNLSSHDIDILFPAIMALELVKQTFLRTMATIEHGIPLLINEEINKILKENAEAKKIMDQIKTYVSVLKAIPIEDKALIEEELMAAVHDTEESYTAAKEKRKAERNKKKRDKRQVVTREENLGEGLEPM